MMKTTRFLAFTFILVAAVSCAKGPESIAGTSISPDLYKGYSCENLRVAKGELSTNVENLSARQSNAKTGDTLGVLLIGLPVSSLSGGSVEAELANNKGQLQAVTQAMTIKGC